jgi:tetratricopeptide (TPR) repeat protein
VDIQRRSAAAWLAVAEDRKSDAVADMRAAADREDATDKSAITPGPLAPAREMLGELLLETGTATAAFKEFEATLRQEPNRFRSVAGAARAAAAAGDRQAAASYYERLLAICARADRPGRPELIEARRANVRRSGSR